MTSKRTNAELRVRAVRLRENHTQKWGGISSAARQPKGMCHRTEGPWSPPLSLVDDTHVFFSRVGRGAFSSEPLLRQTQYSSFYAHQRANCIHSLSSALLLLAVWYDAENSVYLLGNVVSAATPVASTPPPRRQL